MAPVTDSLEHGRPWLPLWQHAPVLAAVARRLCANAADADDLVQETFVRALHARSRYDERGSLRGWLISILRNLDVDRRRKNRHTLRSEDIDMLELAAPEPPAAPVWSDMSLERVARALERVGPELRITFELHAAGRSYYEIASDLRIPKNTVGTRLIRTRRKLKQLLLAGDAFTPRESATRATSRRRDRRDTRPRARLPASTPG